ncbi:hypothetical protein R77560_04786 [Ralstonia thomasii]|uniref:Phage coat protein n=1 Tax=Ralstonia thomasii TaxID=3058596 RepID=A0AAD2BUR6_9RALS|nr:hypothetical protein [Ralstonia sp. LMG 18095]CAJ0808791.1 hypothetical protein R77560_04786 [Ralstonia sp. LMG 18095]
MKYVRRLGYALPLIAIGSQAHATGLDLTPLTSGFDATPIVAGILAAAGVYALVIFAKFAGKKVVGFFGS